MPYARSLHTPRKLRPLHLGTEKSRSAVRSLRLLGRGSQSWFSGALKTSLRLSQAYLQAPLTWKFAPYAGRALPFP